MADTTDTNESPLADQAKQQAQQVVQQGQQMAGQVWNAARSQFWSQLTGQKERAAGSLDDLAEMLRQTGSEMRERGQAGAGGYAEQFADRITQVSSAVHQKEIEEIIADTEDFARARPAVFLGIAAVLGFLLARFLKSSGQATAATA